MGAGDAMGEGVDTMAEAVDTKWCSHFDDSADEFSHAIGSFKRNFDGDPLMNPAFIRALIQRKYYPFSSWFTDDMQLVPVLQMNGMHRSRLRHTDSIAHMSV